MSLATSTDIAARLGRALAAGESDSAELLLEAATALVADAAGVPAADLDADQTPVLRFVCIEAVCRAMANPQGISSLSEQLGAYSSTVRFRDLESGGGLLLTDRERLIVRHAVHGRLSGSSRPESTATEIHDLIYGS